MSVILPNTCADPKDIKGPLFYLLGPEKGVMIGIMNVTRNSPSASARTSAPRYPCAIRRIIHS